MVPEAIDKRFIYNQPRYQAYGLWHAHTGDLIEVFETKAKANSSKSEHFHRVRGVKTEDVNQHEVSD